MYQHDPFDGSHPGLIPKLLGQGTGIEDAVGLVSPNLVFCGNQSFEFRHLYGFLRLGAAERPRFDLIEDLLITESFERFIDQGLLTLILKLVCLLDEFQITPNLIHNLLHGLVPFRQRDYAHQLREIGIALCSKRAKSPHWLQCRRRISR